MFFRTSALLPILILHIPTFVTANDFSPGVIFIRTGLSREKLSIENVERRARTFRFETTENGLFILTSVDGDGPATGVTWGAGEGRFKYHKEDKSEISCHLEGKFTENPPTIQWDFAESGYEAQGDCPLEKEGIKLICDGPQQRCRTD